MRSFTQNTSFKILALTASLMAVPFAGAYAAPLNSFYGPRIDSIRNQLVGIEQGIADAAQGGRITPAEAHTLQMRAANISRTVERTASANRGNLPSGEYHQIMQRFDSLDQHLLADTGAAWDTGDSATSNYPNG